MAEFFGYNTSGNQNSSEIGTDSSSIADDSIASKLKGNTERKASNALVPGNRKSATQSLMNEYAFISYGGEHMAEGSDGIVNMFINSNQQPGLLAGYNQWKQPTAKNIIDWSKSLTSSQAFQGHSIANLPGNQNGSTFSTNFSQTIGNATNQRRAQQATNDVLDNLPTSIGNLKYEWKDFAFLKHFGQIPNNRLITLRRFKLPVLDSGSVIGRNTLIDNMESYGRPKIDYLTSDSSRALTYFGEGTGNTINSFVGFSFNLNWDTNFEADLNNPEINQTGLVNGVGASNRIGGGGFFNPIDLLNVFPSLKDKLDETALNRATGAIGLSTQVAGNDNANSFYDLVIQNKSEFDPFSNGYQYRIYGPVNVISRTSKRARGLSFTGSEISITFHYNVNQVDTINPKLAMLDIISNILTLTYADATFYGGDYRFQREPTEFPLTLDFEDHIRKMMAGEDVSYRDLADSFSGMLTGERVRPNSGDVKFGDYIDSIIQVFSDGIAVGDKSSDEFIKAFNEIGGLLSGDNATDSNESDVKTSSKNTSKTISDQMEAFTQNFVKKGADAKKAFQTIGKTLTEFFTKVDNQVPPGMANPLKSVMNSMVGLGASSIKGISEKILSLQPLISGEPVGEWHLTVGNPMNPVMMIGNLICTNCKLQFGESLGPDDFPTELTATITLQHAKDRDKGDIESMFNMGQGRFYVNVSGEPEPWNSGYSSKSSVNDFGSANGVSSPDGLGGTTSNKQDDEPIKIGEKKDPNLSDKLNEDPIKKISNDLDREINLGLDSIDINPTFNLNSKQTTTSQTKKNG